MWTACALMLSLALATGLAVVPTVHTPPARPRCAPPVAVGKSRSRKWSIGEARKKAPKQKATAARPAARGFGSVGEPEPEAAAAPTAPAPPGALAPADLDENDLAAAAAAAGGETWRAYAAAALAQVAELEAEAEDKHVSPQELLKRQAALEEAADRRRGARTDDEASHGRWNHG